MRDQPQLPEDDALLSAYVDGELPAAETAAIEVRLAVDADARRVVAQLRRLKDMTAGMRIKEPPAEEWEAFWKSYYNGLERSFGWVLLILGGALVLGWAAISAVTAIWHSPDLPRTVRWGALAAVAGMVVLLISVVRERLHKRSRTRYKDVVR